MSTLSEHTEDGNSAAISQQLTDTKEQIYGLLQNFDVLPSRFDRCIFNYIYVYVLGLYFLSDLLFLLARLSISSPVGVVDLLWSGVDAVAAVGIILVPWTFNAWRRSAPKTLRDLVEKKRISIPGSNTAQSYLLFLENYCAALADPRRYFLSGFPMLIVGIFAVASIVQNPALFGTPLFVISYLLHILGVLGGLYCFGIVTWTVYISGWYVRKLVRAFEFRIQPFHLDQCGGLKSLGNFCFGLVSPLLFGSGLFIGNLLLSLMNGAGSGAASWALDVGIPLLFLLVYFLPGIVLAFLLPSWEIHTKMVSEAETDEDLYIAHIEALRQEIQALLATKQVKEARVVQEEKALVETLHTPYPAWPFRFYSKILATVFGVSGSLLIGVTAAALQQHFLPAILKFLSW